MGNSGSSAVKYFKGREYILSGTLSKSRKFKGVQSYNCTDFDNVLFKLSDLKVDSSVIKKLHENYDYINYKNEAYVTYDGLTRIVFALDGSGSNNLDDELLNIYYDVRDGMKLKMDCLYLSFVKKYFPDNLSCIYLIVIGPLVSVHQVIGIKIDNNNNNNDNNLFVCKYGKTDNLKRRANEHYSNYKSIVGNNQLKLNKPYLVKSTHVRCVKLTKAEDSVRKYVAKYAKSGIDISGSSINGTRCNEIVVLTSKEIKDLCTQYESIGNELK